LDFSSTKSTNTSAWRRNSSAIIGGWLEAKDALLVLELAPQSVSTFLHSDAAPARAQIVTLVRDDLLA
jgi:hypothetical protein